MSDLWYGNMGNARLNLAFKPDSSLVTEINSDNIDRGHPVQLTTNWHEVKECPDDDTPDGFIEAYEKHSEHTYILTVLLVGVSGARVSRLVQLPVDTTGSYAPGDEIVHKTGGTFDENDGDSNNGVLGYIIDYDSDSGEAVVAY